MDMVRYINMLHRLGIGSVLMFFQELAGMVIVLSSWEEYGTCPIATDSKGLAPIGYCVISRSVFLVNDTCTERDLKVDYSMDTGSYHNPHYSLHDCPRWVCIVCHTISHTSCKYKLNLQRSGLADLYWSEGLSYAVVYCSTAVWPSVTAIG